MTPTGNQETLQIKKYPNRRYYDATRSCHITLTEMYDLVVAGNDIRITDSKTDADITNLILLQALLERDHLKLDVIPSAIVHSMIRSNRQVLRSSLDRVFGPMMEMWSASQKQFDQYWGGLMKGQRMAPLDWASTMMRPFATSPNKTPAQDNDEHATSEQEEPEPINAAATEPDPLDDLKRQVADLTHRIEDIQSNRHGDE